MRIVSPAMFVLLLGLVTVVLLVLTVVSGDPAQAGARPSTDGTSSHFIWGGEGSR